MNSHTIPTILGNAISVEGDIILSSFNNMPNNRVLYITRDSILKIYSNDLKTCLSERILPIDGVLGIFPDGSILVEKLNFSKDKRSLLKLCPDTLQTMSNQIDSPGPIAIINNECFFTILDNVKEKQFKLYKWDEGSRSYVSTIITFPLITRDNLPPKTHEILFLGNKRYCCSFTSSDNQDASQIVIFDILENHKIKVRGVIKPTDINGLDAKREVCMLALPNGQLLTYQVTGDYRNDHLQVWNTTSLLCEKKWEWAKIQKPINFEYPAPYFRIKSFPDSKHLLLVGQGKGADLYLFNMDKLVLKPIKLNMKMGFNGHHHVLTNGQILAFVCPNNDDYLQVIRFNVNEIIPYQEKIKKYLILQFFFKDKLPEDVTKQIFSTVFSGEDETSKVNNTEDDDNQKSHRGCSLF